MIAHLNNSFFDVQHKAIMALSIVPSVFMRDQDADSSLEEEIVEHYHDDLPSPSTLQQELHMWKWKWKLVEKSGHPDTPSKSLELANQSMFPNIHILLHLFLHCLWQIVSVSAVSEFLVSSKCTSTLPWDHRE